MAEVMVGGESSELDPKDEAEKEFDTIECKNCGQLFVKKRAWSLFCTTECRMEAHQKERSSAVKEYRMMLKNRGVSNA